MTNTENPWGFPSKLDFSRWTIITDDHPDGISVRELKDEYRQAYEAQKTQD